MCIHMYNRKTQNHQWIQKSKIERAFYDLIRNKQQLHGNALHLQKDTEAWFTKWRILIHQIFHSNFIKIKLLLRYIWSCSSFQINTQCSFRGIIHYGHQPQWKSYLAYETITYWGRNAMSLTRLKAIKMCHFCNLFLNPPFLAIINCLVTVTKASFLEKISWLTLELTEIIRSDKHENLQLSIIYIYEEDTLLWLFARKFNR